MHGLLNPLSHQHVGKAVVAGISQGWALADPAKRSAKLIFELNVERALQ
jgi:hypothetical protein